MATIEFLQKRIAGKEKEIEKLNKKIARIVKAKESNWENNPYYYNENDLKWTQRDIDQAEMSLKDYKDQLEVATQKANSRDVAVINEFLDRWEKNSIEYFKEEYELYKEAYEEYKKEDHKYTDWFNNESWKLRREDPEEYKRVYKEKREANRDLENQFRARWSHVTQFFHGDLSWEDTMIKDIHNERERKYDFIIERTNNIVGQITDASELEIDPRGDLNGIITGTKGKARVNTIGAGGYNQNIVNPETGRHGQIYHWRCLIKPVK